LPTGSVPPSVLVAASRLAERVIRAHVADGVERAGVRRSISAFDLCANSVIGVDVQERPEFGKVMDVGREVSDEGCTIPAVSAPRVLARVPPERRVAARFARQADRAALAVEALSPG
jgi:hypothetical protein